MRAVTDGRYQVHYLPALLCYAMRLIIMFACMDQSMTYFGVLFLKVHVVIAFKQCGTQIAGLEITDYPLVRD